MLSDGRLVVLMQDGEPDALGFTIDTADILYLVHHGQAYSLATDAVPDDTRNDTLAIRVPLTASPGDCGGKAVLHMVGTVALMQADDSYRALADDDFGQTFVISFKRAELGTGTSGARGLSKVGYCWVHCDQNGVVDCVCSGHAFCWCFCGIGNEPHCMGLFFELVTQL